MLINNVKVKNEKTLIIISIFLISIATLSILFVDSYLGTKYSNLITIVTAIIGAVSLFVQFRKRQKN